MAKLVCLQLIWVVLGVAYNLVSLCQANNGRVALTPTPPIPAIIFLLCVVPIILLGATNNYLFIYAVLNAIVMALILYSGIVVHVMAAMKSGSPEGYSSMMALSVGVAINLFGVAVGLFGSWRATALSLSG